ncbi:EF-hand domain [Trypanosoma melophagium]|uniref:EF-hand domain n=1 Tax=Trypanosoma melophagium TaxID=715481 RepID=UPI003519F2AD|nr:EF-hand domain [Trypanosoma melophagium]
MAYAPPYPWYPQQPQQPPIPISMPTMYPQTQTMHPQPQQPILYPQPQPQPSQQPPTVKPIMDAETMRQFRAVDRMNRGKIGVAELNNALNASGMRFSYATTERLLLMYDMDYDGEIFFNEFQMLLEYIQYMGAAFRRRDTSGDGRLSGDEVRVALKENGYILSDSAFQVMMRKFDRLKRGSLGLDDYIEISIFLTNLSNAFSENVNADGKVTFDFEKFLMVSLSLL